MFLLVIGESEQVNIDGFRKQDTEIWAVGPSDFTEDAAISLFDDRDQFKGFEKALGMGPPIPCIDKLVTMAGNPLLFFRSIST